MQYDELQAIWETQRRRPVFAVNDFGLHMELYRTRARARRRLFWGDVALFVCAPFLLFFLTVPVLEFFIQRPAEQFPPDELPMNLWDVLACLVGIVLVVLAVWSMYASRRKHEKHQKMFAPSLRQEIELGIAQLDFEISMVTSGLTLRIVAAFNIAMIVLCWEVGRLNDKPLPWDLLLITVPFLVGGLVSIIPATRRAVEQALQRKRALEALRAQLDENPAQY